MRGRRSALFLALAVAGVGLQAPAAHAVVTTLYVQSGPGTNCSDSGPGSSSQPFCTISKAASIVQAGQTVMVGYGSYPETVTISAVANPAAPIRFVGQASTQDPLATWVGSNGGTTSGAHAFVLQGAQDVTITGFAVSGTQESVLVQNSQDITVDQIGVANPSGTTPDVLVDNSTTVTVSRSTLNFGISLGSVNEATIADDVITGGEYTSSGTAPAISATGSNNAVIVNDTITSMCGPGVDLEGNSGHATIENLIVDTSAGSGGGTCGSPNTAITVASGSTIGSKSDYNVVNTGTSTLYSWNGTGYSSLAAYTAATSQGTRDIVADPKLTRAPENFTTSAPIYPTEGSPEIDSADATWAPSTDFAGMSRVDDPLVANTGNGTPSYVDRGAYEFQDPIALATPAAKHVPGGGPLDVNISTGVTAAWSKNITYTYNFEDGTPNLVTTASTVRHDFASAGSEYVVISANDGYATNPQYDQNALVSANVGADYTPLNPVRILDTRHAIGVSTTTPVLANSDVVLPVTGMHGIPSGGGISAVVLNVTATQPTAGGYLTVYPDGNPLTGSNLNFVAGQTVPNQVTVQVRDGKIRFHNGSAGTVHVVADAEGYYADSGYGYASIIPERVLDTRHAVGVPGTSPVPAGGHLSLDLSSKIAAGSKAVTLNVTVTQPTAGGYVTVYPDGTTAPAASNLNFVAGETVPNLVTVPVHNGKVDFYNGSAGTVHLVADLAGVYGDSTTDATLGFQPFGSFRVIDTRTSGTGPIGANTALHVGATWFPSDGSIPAIGTGALLNVTVTRPGSGGYLTVYPDGSTRPTASNLNFSTGETVPNSVSTTFGKDGIDIYNGSAGHTDVVIDLEGYFIPPLA